VAVLALVAGAFVGWRLTVRPDLVLEGGMARAAGVPADGLGYSAAFDLELKKVGEPSPADFARLFEGKAVYLPRLSWSPTTAKSGDRFPRAPTAPDARVRVRGEEEKQARQYAEAIGKPLPKDKPVFLPAKGGFDFRLDKAEMALFEKNGFVVSERLGSSS